MSFYSLTSTFCAGLNQIKGVEGSCVRVQAGVKLADLHNYLAEQDLEVSFSPEIGDDTVGSLVVCTSKDSSVDGPGYLSALVTEVTYVDKDGCLVVLSLAKDPSALLAFTCSYGMMGIVVEAVPEVRRRIAVTTTAYAFMTRSGEDAAAHLAQAHAFSDALFAILVPGSDHLYIEARSKASSSAAQLARSAACFLQGAPLGRAMAMLLSGANPPTTHYRSAFVNRYPAVQPGSRRLDFSFVEFDLPQLQSVVAECWERHFEFKDRTGWAPSGDGVYFVPRGWTQQRALQHNVSGAKALAKPCGNFSGPPGVSFMLDPITGDCDDPRWLQFNLEYSAWAVSRGATPSLSQSKGLLPGQAGLPRHLTRSRFLTPHYAQFVE
uniref:FAD linked oxidase N-terminal domain-containing protein n=1 Tax=Tetradesmus obliquus TaxID=3088 RepID=A0A383V943_TETOB|eukprot:jgi/Sobl393_1/15564/SZX61114.1